MWKVAAGTIVFAISLAAQGPTPSPLKIANFTLSQFEDGASMGNASIVPGETLFVSFQAENYKATADGKVELKANFQALDPRGIEIQPATNDAVKTTLAQEDKGWKPKFRAQLQVPAIAPPGAYRIKYSVTDAQSKQSGSGEVAFEVRGKDVAPSAELVIRNLQFFRGEEDSTPLAIAAYRPGDTLWCRFDITGYKYGPENAIEASYDVAVLNADGKQIFAQQNAATEKTKAFYPQPWVPGGVNLSLQKNMNVGGYSVVITAHDAVGGQTATAKSDFKLE